MKEGAEKYDTPGLFQSPRGGGFAINKPYDVLA